MNSDLVLAILLVAAIALLVRVLLDFADGHQSKAYRGRARHGRR
jgi:phosphatidylglycerophosphate synthase